MKKYILICAFMVSTTVAVLAQSGNWSNETVRAAGWAFSIESGATNQIGSAAELAQFAWLVNKGVDFTNTVTLITNSLDLSEHFWTPAGNHDKPFAGTLTTAAGVILDGMTIKDDNFSTNGFEHIGLFGRIGKAGRVEHLVLTNISINIKTSCSVGGVAGSSLGLIANCAVHGTINIAGYAYAGGIVGYISGTIANCMNRSEVSVVGNDSDWLRVGGIVGYGFGAARGDMVVNCENYGSVHGEAAGTSTIYIYIGGIAGDNSTKIMNCANYGTVSGKGGSEINAGGIAGNSTGPTANCMSVGAVRGSGTRHAFHIHAGGIVGHCESSVSFNYWNAAATEPALDVVGYQGFLAYITNSVPFNAETGVLASPVDVGGVVKTEILLDALNAWTANPISAWMGDFSTVNVRPHTEFPYATWRSRILPRVLSSGEEAKNDK